MSALREYEKQLKTAVSQRRSIILIETDDYATEENRIERIFGELGIKLSEPDSENFGENIYKWLPGIGKRSLLSMGESIDESLSESIKEMPSRGDSTKSILIILGLHFFYEMFSDETVQVTTLLYDFYTQNEPKSPNDRSFIIIISPKVEMPIEIKNCVYTITPPYPDDEDIEKELGLDCPFNEIVFNEDGNYQVSNKRYIFKPTFFSDEGVGDVYDENKKNLIKALKGLRLSEIENLLKYCNEPYTIAGFNIKDFEESKIRMVQDSGLLKVERVQEKYYDFVGDIDGLKRYMEKEKGVIDNRAYYNEKMPLPKGILLVGPPGCGKSETTKAIASILKMPLYSMDMGKLLGGLMGQSEQNFEKALAIAEAAQPCVLRIDEIEKAFAGSGTDQNEQTMTHIVGHFLTWMQERTSLVYLVATANNLEMLRPEFLRKGRWDEIFYLSYPSADGIRKIVVSCLKKYGLCMEDKDKNYEDEEYDEKGEKIEKSPIGNETKKIIEDFYRKNNAIKVSGAEIVDVIEQLYKSQFIKNPHSNLSKELKINMFLNKLNELTQKERDVEIDKVIKKEMLEIEIEQLLKSVSSFERKEQKIRALLEEKYNVEINRMKDEEMKSLEINSRFSSGNDFYYSQKPQIYKALEEKYDKEKMIQCALFDIRLNMLVQEGRLEEKDKDRLRDLLKRKYEDGNGEEYYVSKGYKSASTWPPQE